MDDSDWITVALSPAAWGPDAIRLRRFNAANVLIAGSLALLSIAGGLRLASLVQELAAQWAGIDLLHSHHDFLAFYSAAHYVLAGQVGNIYNSTALATYQRTLVPHSVGAVGYMPFLNPPFAAVIQAPLGLLPEGIARLVWFGANAVLAASIAGWLTSSMRGKQRVLASLMILVTFPFYQTLIEGQWSLILLSGCLLAVRFARRGSYGRSGACLSVLWLKPHLAVIVLTGLVLFRFRRIALGMVATAGLVAALTLPITGTHAYVAYVPFLFNVFRDHFNGAGALHPAVWQGKLSLAEGLNGLFVGLFSQSSVVIVDVLSVVSIGATLVLFRKAALGARPGFGYVRNELMLVASVALVLLIDPHLFVQDITLLFLVVPLLSPHLRSPFVLVIGLCLLTEAPLLDAFVRLHLFTIGLWGLMIVICLAVVRGFQPERPAALDVARMPGAYWLKGTSPACAFDPVSSAGPGVP